jgi:TRAP-type C4-dicarboxylate transport system substrate-binding protein
MLTGHVITPLCVIINEKSWQKLTPAYQKILMDAVKEARDLNNKLTQSQEESLLTTFKKAGMTIIQPDVESFKRAAAGIPGQFENLWGKGLYDKVVNTK